MSCRGGKRSLGRSLPTRLVTALACLVRLASLLSWGPFDGRAPPTPRLVDGEGRPDFFLDPPGSCGGALEGLYELVPESGTRG